MADVNKLTGQVFGPVHIDNIDNSDEMGSIDHKYVLLGYEQKRAEHSGEYAKMTGVIIFQVKKIMQKRKTKS